MEGVTSTPLCECRSKRGRSYLRFYSSPDSKVTSADIDTMRYTIAIEPIAGRNARCLEKLPIPTSVHSFDSTHVVHSPSLRPQTLLSVQYDALQVPLADSALFFWNRRFLEHFEVHGGQNALPDSIGTVPQITL